MADKLISVFRSVVPDGQQMLPRSSCVQLLQETCGNLLEERLHEILQEAGQPGDGPVDFIAFISWLYQQPVPHLFTDSMAAHQTLPSPQDVAHLGDLFGAFPFRGYIDKAEHRAITLRQLWQVLHFVAKRCHQWYDTRSASFLSVQCVNLYQVNEWLILPSTQPNNCSFVELLSALDQMPLWFVSHWWGEPILDFVRCLERHATVRMLTEDAPYWVCAYANRQHSLSQDVTMDPRESSFFKAMQLAAGVLLVLDDLATPFTRIWCAFEESVALTFTEDRASPMLLDIVSCQAGSAQLITDGITEFERQKEATLGEGGSAMLGISSAALQIKSEREIHFPSEVICKGLQVELESAEASQEADRVHILNCLVGRDLEALPPLTVHEKYDEVNHMLRSRFALVAWRQALLEGRAKEFALAEALASDRMRKKVTLELHSTGLTDDDLQNIAEGLHPALRELVISFCNTSITDDGLKVFAGQIPGSLHEFNLNIGLCSSISSKGVEALAYNLPAALERLVLTASCISDPASSFAHVASKLPCGLRELELVFSGSHPMLLAMTMQSKGNDDKEYVRGPGLAILAQCMPGLLRRLVLHFEYQDWITDDDLANLASSFPSTLEELHLNLSACAGIGNKGIQSIGRSLPSSLRSLLLRLGCTATGSAGLSELAASMSAGLHALNLEFQACDALSDEGILALAEHLPTCVEDLQLNFSWASLPGPIPMRSEPAKGPKLGSSGIAALGRKLCQTLRVLSLGISGCINVKEDALITVAENLPSSLQILRLLVGQCSGCGDSFVQVLSERLPEHLDELHLDMHSSSVSDVGIVALARCVPPNISNLVLNFSTCKNASDAGVHAAAEMLPCLQKLEILKIAFQMCDISESALQFFCSKIPSNLLEAGIHFEGCTQILHSGDGSEALSSALKPIKQRLAALSEKVCNFIADDIVQNWQEHTYAVRLHPRMGFVLGMNLRMRGAELLVTCVSSATETTGSLAGAWNDAHPDALIRPGDTIVRVNNVEGNTKLMLDELQQECELVLKLLPQSFTYNLTFEDLGVISPLGCSFSTHGERLYIMEISRRTGLLCAWNQCHPSKQVRQGDRILKVNHVEGKPSLMIKESRNAQIRHLKLQRSRDT